MFITATTYLSNFLKKIFSPIFISFIQKFDSVTSKNSSKVGPCVQIGIWTFGVQPVIAVIMLYCMMFYISCELFALLGISMFGFPSLHFAWCTRNSLGLMLVLWMQVPMLTFICYGWAIHKSPCLERSAPKLICNCNCLRDSWKHWMVLNQQYCQMAFRSWTVFQLFSLTKWHSFMYIL